jgi:hypothetical protein
MAYTASPARGIQSELARSAEFILALALSVDVEERIASAALGYLPDIT